MRLGVLGGSFNPPHNGHLVIASDAFERLALDSLIVMPAFANPLKGTTVPGATPEQRLEMARLAFGNDARFEVSSMEIDRGGLSFTVETLAALRASRPGAELILLLGADALASLDRWKDPDGIRTLARVAALTRVGGEVPEGVEVVTTRLVDISSTEIRERVAAGRSIRGFVPESVEHYIAEAKLYASAAA